MKSARTYSQQQAQNCNSHKNCIDQHYQKCRKQRQRQISYTIFPRQSLDAQTNVHIKYTNQAKYNFETLAYEKYVKGKQPETQNEKNFVKNFYLQNVPDKKCMTNEIVKQLEEEVYPFNAYNLAQGATKDYYAFEFKRQQYLVTARRRAKNSSNIFGKQLKLQNQNNQVQRAKWITKILATLEDLGQRMFGLANGNKQNEAQNGKQRIFLSQKSYVNQSYLKEYKIKDTETSKKIFQDLRANMLRKKKQFEDQRIKNKNVNMTSSYISQTTNQSSVTSQSMVSAVSEALQMQTEEEMVKRLCDFQQLKKKWKTTDVQKIKDLILSSLTRKVIQDCQGQKAKQISTYKRQCKSIPSKIHKKEQNNSSQKNDSKRPKTSIKKKETEVKIVSKSKLSKQQLQTKQDLMKVGQLDSVGSKYQKVRNFSNLFKKKQESMRLNLSIIQQQQSKSSNLKINFRAVQRKQLQTDPMCRGYKTARTTASYLRH